MEREMGKINDAALLLEFKDRVEMAKKIKDLEIQLHQAMGALGYPVPEDIPESNLKCGLCSSKEKRIIETEAQKHTLYQVIRIISEAR